MFEPGFERPTFLEFWTMMKLWKRLKILSKEVQNFQKYLEGLSWKFSRYWKIESSSLVGAQPPTCCALARHLIGKMVILCSLAHRHAQPSWFFYLDWTVFGNYSKVVQMGRHLAVGGTPEQPITLWHLKPPNWVDMLLKGETCKRESPCGRPPRRQQIAMGAPTFNNQTTLERGDEFSENPGKWNPAQHLFFFFVQNSDQSIKSWHLRPHGTYSCTRHGKPSKTVFGDKLDGNPCEKLLPMLDI